MHAMGAQLWNEYGIWLVNHVRLRKLGYSQLMAQLHNTPFTYILERDQNRADDGIILREEFYREKDIDIGIYDHRDDCSVLEMLVALSIRVNDEYTGDPSGESHPEWIFWEMICNLGLDVFDDRHYESDEVEYILDRWMDRDFLYDGSGSVFPIAGPMRDQRRIEIWSQMNEYLTGKGW